jgi:hypothetical protein
MNKFDKTEHLIFNLSMEDRIKFCQKMVLDMVGRKLSWKEGKQYYHEMFDCDTYENNIYIVMVFRGKKADWLIDDPQLKGQMTYLSIKNRDKTAIHDWRHFQEIKNELVGSDCEAVEIYPNENRLVDTANQYHLFVFPKDYKLPFGWKVRSVLKEEAVGGYNKRGQRAINE